MKTISVFNAKEVSIILEDLFLSHEIIDDNNLLVREEDYDEVMGVLYMVDALESAA